MFAVIVVLVALAVGALWFVVRYRAHEAREAALREALQQQADRAKERSPGLGRMRGGNTGRQGPTTWRRSRGGTGRGQAPGAGPAGQQNRGQEPEGE